MNKYKLGILINPNAGQNQSYEYQKVVEFATENNINFAVTPHVEDIIKFLVELLVEKQINLLAIWGGDGSLQKTMDALFTLLSLGRINEFPVIILLGGGTLNSIKIYLGWRGKCKNPLKVLKKIYKAVSKDKDLPLLDLFPLEISFGWQHHYGFIAFGGALYLLAKVFIQGKKTSLAYLIKTLKSLLSALGVTKLYQKYLHFHKYKYILDGVELEEQDYLGFLLSVFPRPFPGLKPFVGSEDNKLYFLTTSLTAKQVVYRLVLLARGKIRKNPLVINKALQSLKIQGPDSAFFLDGEELLPCDLLATFQVAKKFFSFVKKF